MKIGNLIALLIVAAGMTCSMPAQTAQAADAKTPVTSETSPAIDLSKVPLQEGIHEVYRETKSGLRIFRIVNGGKEIASFAVDKKGEVLTQNVGCGAVVCHGSGSYRVCWINISQCPIDNH